jgi:ABC-type multidrug transport system permease subunit
MNRWKALSQLILARLREFYREPEVIFWVYGFPVMLAVGLGIAFKNKEPEPTDVDVQEVAASSEATGLVEYLQAHQVKAHLLSEAECRQRLRIGKTALIVVPRPEGYVYVYDPTRADSVGARNQVDMLVQRWKAGSAAWPSEDALVTEPGSRYIDFLMPGLIGMNLMGGGLWGVGFVIVDMRIRRLLKRLLATPMRRGDFLAAILGARMVFMFPEILLMLFVGWVGFGVPMQGSLGTLALTILMGALAFSGIGLLVACRADKTETVSGLMNAVMLPMWLLSGIFFSSKRFPDVAQPFIQALPLTQLNDALREVMLEGASVAAIGWRLAILAAYAVVTFYLALKWFRWQ